jgi:hypothetical protein
VDPAVAYVFHRDDQIVFAARTELDDAASNALLEVLAD